MALRKVTLADLPKVGLDAAAQMFNVELEKAVRDLCDRPGDKSERVVTLKFRLAPSVDQAGVCDGAMGQFECHAKLPNQKTRAYAFGTNAAGHLLFNDASPDDAKQHTLDELKE